MPPTRIIRRSGRRFACACHSPGVARALLTLVVAVMLLLLPGAPEADVRRSLSIFRPLAVAVLFPVAWTAAADLSRLARVGRASHMAQRRCSAGGAPVRSHSIVLGYTLRALFGYLSLISLTFLTSVLTRNRPDVIRPRAKALAASQ